MRVNVVPAISVAEATELLPGVIAKLENPIVAGNPIFQLDLLGQRSFLESIIAGTYIPQNAPAPPHFH